MLPGATIASASTLLLIPICYNIEFLPYTCKKESASWGLRFYLPDYFATWVFFIWPCAVHQRQYSWYSLRQKKFPSSTSVTKPPTQNSCSREFPLIMSTSSPTCCPTKHSLNNLNTACGFRNKTENCLNKRLSCISEK